ncbi:MAG: hypothetical protein KDK23_09455 [Leptospiraceae bacterium]|nr:hypothetical protein [Leptospiraceae bacterium]
MQHLRRAIVIALLFIISCGPSEPVQLRVNLQKGDKYVQTVVTDQSIKQQIMGMAEAQEQKTKTSITYTVECTEVDDSGTTIKVTYDRIQVEKDGSSGKSSYDSEKDKEPTNPDALAYAKMIDHGFSVKLSPRSEVVDMIGIEEFLERVYSSLELPDDETGRQIRQMLKTQFGPQTMKHMLERSYIPYPEKEVGEGDSWNKLVDMGGAGIPIQVDSTYTIKDLGSSEVILETRGKISSDKEQAMKILSMEMKYNLSGTMDGEQVVDLDRGVLVESSVVQEMKGDMIIHGAPGMPAGGEGMKIPMEMTTKITLTTE